MGEHVNVLFHNHEGDGFRYSYPMIQYKRINGQAAIVCVGDGVEEIGNFFRNSDFCLQLGDGETVVFEIDSVVPHRTLVQIWDSWFSYHLRNWLPFNSENYQKYMQLDGVVERTQMLERILIGNVLSACKGLGVVMEHEIQCKVIDLDEPRVTRFKNMPYLCFDGQFKCNVSLPSYIGLGKGSSIGHGIIVGKKVND